MGQSAYVFPASFAQQRLWVLDQMEPGNPAYNIPVALHLVGKLNLEILEQAINEIMRRHEILRTVFAESEGQPVQVIKPPSAASLPLIDLCMFDLERAEAEAVKLAESEATRKSDLARGPLFRNRVLKLSEQDHALLMTMHHIISDGWSLGALAQEISVLYESMSDGRPSPLPELNLQYADFSVWQRRSLSDQVFEEQLEYWKRQLAGSSGILQFPYDRHRPLLSSYNGATERAVAPKDLIYHLREFSNRQGITLFVTLLGALNVLLYRYSGQEDINVGTPVANRSEEETEQMIGCFVNNLVIRADLSCKPNFDELCRRINQTALAAYSNQDLPFEKIVEELQPERDLGRTPLYQVMMTLQNSLTTRLRLQGVALAPFDVDSRTAELDLLMFLEEKETGMEIALQYSLDLFEPPTIGRLLGNFKTLLEAVREDANRPITSLPLLAQAEYEQIVFDWNRTDADYSRRLCVHEKFEDQARLTPDAIAVVSEDQQLSYGTLNACANQLARYIKKLGVGPETIVGICVERSPELIISIFGTLKAGGAYLPLDPAYPLDRLNFMLEDSGAAMLLTRRQFIHYPPGRGTRIIYLDGDSDDWNAISNESHFDLNSMAGPENLVYVIYTSGSTGKPKGTMIQHGSLVSYIETVIDGYGVEFDDRVLQFCSISFDISAEEIYPCLTTGATLVMRTDWMLESVPKFLATCERWNISMLSLPTAYWHEITAALGAEVPTLPDSLRLIIIAGERALPERLAKWYRHSGGRTRLINTYGLTESTIISTLADLTEAPPASSELREVSIGRAINNTRIYILNGDQQPQPINSVGELYIGGLLLARGYLNRPKETSERFLPDHFGGEPGNRFYRTGDLARFLPDGNIEFLGRNDQQIKIRGFRVELSEIETEMANNPSLRDAVVIAIDGVTGEKQLIAYIVPNEGSAITHNELRSFLKRKLPDYMVPSAFVSLDSLPLTPNGKVDRAALMANNRVSPMLEFDYVAPRNELERIITGVWEEVLKIANVGIDHSFFDLGGHSLLMIKLRGRLQQILGREVPMVELFKYPTIRSFVEFLSEEEFRPIQVEKSFADERARRGARKMRRNLRQKGQ